MYQNNVGMDITDEGFMRERASADDFVFLSKVFESYGVFFPTDFKSYMITLSQKTENDHYHLTRWIRNGRVNNIYELLAAHFNASQYAPMKLTEAMLKGINEAAEYILNDPNLKNSCKFNKSEIFTMLMLSMIRCHCAVLYFKHLSKTPETAIKPWFTITLKRLINYRVDETGSTKRKTKYAFVIRD